jgi:glycogen synthase
MRRAAMARTFAWQRSARRYKKVYERATGSVLNANATS